ncbi:hypothetical protein BJV82DRAFT_604112 [Fennellomyces sp. T-0311]|nr:hypothetical protein BJV82DRAFT_604112 [Fennellomyces sp. T-0311]
MTSINQTRVCLRRINSTEYPPQFHLVPVPNPNESFYFNQEPIGATIQDVDGTQAKMETASVHLTDQRLVFILQDHSVANITASTFQIDLEKVASIKCRLTFRYGIQLGLFLIGDSTPVRLQIVLAKKDRHRRDAFKEYLSMIMAGLTSRKKVLAMHHRAFPFHCDQLPSYDQALSDTTLDPASTDNGSMDTLPPAYST